MWNLSHKLGPIVGDGVGHSKPVDDVGEERYDLFRPEVRDGAHVNPFGEFIDGD
jgi:hypothetical protein